MRFGTPAQSRDPGMKRAYAAILQAGLPEFSDENADDAVPATTVISRHAPFDPTPPAVPGVPTIDTPALQKMTQQSPPPLLIDMGDGTVRPPGAIAGNFDPMSAASAKHFAASLPPHAGRPVVVLGDGVYGWRAYNGVLQLRAAGVANLLWYRGGEEAWAKAGLPAEDARAP